MGMEHMSDIDKRMLEDEYTQVHQPDIERLAEVVTRAKGPDRSMAEFAEACQIGASTMSRIANGKITRPLNIEMLRAIFINKDPNFQMMFKWFAHVNGMTPTRLVEQERSSFTRYDLVRMRKSNRIAMKSTLLKEIFNRGITISQNREDDVRTLPGGVLLGSEFSVLIQSRRMNQKWNFVFFPDSIITEVVRGFSPMPNMRASLSQSLDVAKNFFLADAWYPDELNGDKQSFVFANRELYNSFTDAVREAPLRSHMSAILIDPEKEELVEEQVFSNPHGLPDVFSIHSSDYEPKCVDEKGQFFFFFGDEDTDDDDNDY